MDENPQTQEPEVLQSPTQVNLSQPSDNPEELVDSTYPVEVSPEVQAQQEEAPSQEDTETAPEDVVDTPTTNAEEQSTPNVVSDPNQVAVDAEARKEKLKEAYGENYSEVHVPQQQVVAHDVKEGDLSLLADNYPNRIKFSK